MIRIFEAPHNPPQQPYDWASPYDWDDPLQDSGLRDGDETSPPSQAPEPNTPNRLLFLGSWQREPGSNVVRHLGVDACYLTAQDEHLK